MCKTVYPIFAICVALWFTGCRPADDALIVPGKRVGSIVLGRTRLVDVSGPDGHVLGLFARQGMSFGVDSHSTVNDIDISKRTYTTKEGLGVGDTEDRIRQVYGAPDVSQIPLMAGSVQKATFAKRALHYHGIRWLIDDEGHAYMIMVSEQ
jgi:hypothetical protein